MFSNVVLITQQKKEAPHHFGSDSRKAVVEIVLSHQDHFAKVVKILAMDGEGKAMIVDSLSCRYNEGLCILYSAREKGCIVMMHHTEVLIVLAAFGHHAFFFDEGEDVTVFKKSLAIQI